MRVAVIGGRPPVDFRKIVAPAARGYPWPVQIISIQYLRAIAALMVVLFHLHPQLERMGVRAWPGEWLSSGVDIFFVVSGFIMWWTTCTGDVSPGDFMRRRIHRVVPVYWALSAVYVAVLLVAPRLMQSGVLELPHAVASFFFIPVLHPVTGYMMPLVTPGWTLNYEMFFYGIFALGLFLPRAHRLAFVSLAMVLLVLLGQLVDPQSRVADFYTSTLLLEFLFGVWLGVLFEAGRVLPPRALPLAALVAVVALVGLQRFATSETRFLFMGLPAMAVVFVAVSWERWRPVRGLPVALLLGNASYSIYLVHQLALSATAQAWRRAFDGPPWLVGSSFALAGVAVSVGLGLACHRLVEQPLGRLTRPLVARPAAAPQALPQPHPGSG